MKDSSITNTDKYKIVRNVFMIIFIINLPVFIWLGFTENLIMAWITVILLLIGIYFIRSKNKFSNKDQQANTPSSDTVTDINEAEKRISQALKKKEQIDFYISLDYKDFEELSNRFRSLNLLLNYPIKLKIPVENNYKAYDLIKDKFKYYYHKIEKIDSKDFHIINTTIGKCYYTEPLPQLLVPISRIVTCIFLNEEFPFSVFKPAIYAYKNFETNSIYDHLSKPESRTILRTELKVIEREVEVIEPRTCGSKERGLSFTAIDFETANPKRSSACSVGIVTVENGVIINRIHQLINPNTEFSGINMSIHKITPNMVVNMPTFIEYWEDKLNELLSNQLIIAHNAANFDMSVLRASLKENYLSLPDLEYGCTMKAATSLGYPPKLKDISTQLGLGIDHHNALSDAEVCSQFAIYAWQKTNSFEHFDIRRF